LFVISPLIGITSIIADTSLANIGDTARSNVPLHISVFFKHMEGSILKRNPMNAISAVKPLQISVVFKNMKKIIL
jgi:hypothetical protein